ncbi:hypothetical protein [Nannocystis sp.]|uniref:hypothetical protein n=1 Tax=Nannocystis sp. TaxID=1962667 RepID=UPI0025F22138|nr:hypothetical protein [Nannocystis sp.]MBK7828393.1 hypothetical protein [Nannocystis sp.]
MTEIRLFAVIDALERLGCVTPVRPARGQPLEGTLREVVRLLDPLVLQLLMAGYFVEEIDLATSEATRAEIGSVDMRSGSALRGSPRGWDAPAKRAAVALWVVPQYPWTQADALGLSCQASRLPAAAGIKITFDTTRPGWLVIDVGDMKDAAAMLEPLAARLAALHEQLHGALIAWQSEVKPGDAPPSCGLMTILDPDEWWPVAVPWSSMRVVDDRSGPLVDLARLVHDLCAEPGGRAALLLAETAPASAPTLGQRWAELRPDDDNFFADLKETVEQHYATFQAADITTPPTFNGLAAELSSLPLTMALFLLHALSVLDAFRGQDALTAELRTTPDDEERRYDYFRALVLEHIPPLVVDAFKAKKVLAGKMMCAVPPIEFDEAEGAINIVGIRSMADWRPFPPKVDSYDDMICVVWREGGRKHCQGWRATVDPGIFEPTEEYKNVSHVENGQWRYRLGKHKGSSKIAYPAVVPYKVWWWYAPPGAARNGKSTTMEVDGDVSDVKIHAGSASDHVGKTSRGCQVFYGGNGAAAWTAFMDIVDRAINKDDIPYTLIDSSMLPDPTPLRAGGK